VIQVKCDAAIAIIQQNAQKIRIFVENYILILTTKLVSNSE